MFIRIVTDLSLMAAVLLQPCHSLMHISAECKETALPAIRYIRIKWPQMDDTGGKLLDVRLASARNGLWQACGEGVLAMAQGGAVIAVDEWAFDGMVEATVWMDGELVGGMSSVDMRACLKYGA